MKLKRLKSGEEHDVYFCAVVKCRRQSTIVIASRHPAYGLCDEHWRQRCEEEEKQPVQEIKK